MSLAACNSDGDANPVAAGAREIAVAADNFSFDPEEITVKTGADAAITLTSVDIVHDFTVNELDLELTARAGDTTRAGFRADQPGRYTFYCTQPGHRAAGMEGTLIVEPPQ